MEDKYNKELEDLKKKQEKEMRELKQKQEEKKELEEEKNKKEFEEKEEKKAETKSGIKEKSEIEEEPEEDLADKVTGKFWAFVGIFIIVALAIFCYNHFSVDAGEVENAPIADGMTDKMPILGDTVKLEFYVMSQCPFGTQVEDGIAPVLEAMGENIDFTIDYIATDLGEGEFRSLHGQPEVDENIRQLCAMEYNPGEYMDYIICQNKDIKNLEKNFDTCAKKAGLDIESVTACIEGEEGIELHKESTKRSEDVEARGSPTIYLDGELYSGGRDAASFQRAICQHIEHPACDEVSACSSDTDCKPKEGMIPICKNPGTADAECVYEKPTTVYMVLLNDDECKTCDTTRIKDVTKQLFPGVIVEEVDVKSEEGMAVVDELGLTYIPAYIFTPELVDTNTWKTNTQIRGAFEKVGDNYKLRDAATGASTFIDKEKENAFFKTIGVELGDNRPQLDFFVMSYCPYGNQAEELIWPVFELLGEYADFNPHWVIYSDYMGGGPDYCIDEDSQLCSMHGVTELNQNIREECVLIEYDMDKFWSFVVAMNKACNAQNADKCWKPVARGMNIDVELIEECFEDNALKISNRDLELGGKLGVSGSPAIFIDGKKYSGERSEEGFKGALCAAFDKPPKECGEKLEGAGAGAPAAGACG